MKKFTISMISFLTLIILCLPISSLSAAPENSAQAAIVMEVETGRVLYEKKAHEKLPMASTTKIMTAILAIENSNLSDIVTVSPRASGIEGSSLYLAAGERLTMKQLLYGLMLRSGNDAAFAIAEHVGKSAEKFADMMNRKARELGAINTNFVNPHGLHHEDHYTTAYDLALISAYAMKNPIFREIVSTKYYKIPWEGQAWDRVLMNKNALLWNYEGANGIKTGYTKAAGRCLASAALRNNMQLVAVVLNCPPWFDDSAALLDYGFSHYEMEKLFEKGEIVGEIAVKNGFQKKVDLVLKEDISIPLAEGEMEKLKISIKHPDYIKAPVEKGAKIGTIEIVIGNTKISKDLYAASQVKENTFPSNLRNLINQWIAKAQKNLSS